MNYSTQSLPSWILAGFCLLIACGWQVQAQQAPAPAALFEAPPVAASPTAPYISDIPASGAAMEGPASAGGAVMSPVQSTASAIRPAPTSSAPDARSAIAAAAKSALPEPAMLLDQAFAKLAERRSVVAKVRHRANLYGRELIGSGDYAQGPNRSRLLRYELRMQANQHVVNLLQVCDGRYLWISRLLELEPEIQRVEIDRVLAALEGQSAQQAHGAIQQAIAIGGLGHVLDTIRKDFSFHGISRSQLGDVPVYATVGSWKSTARDGLPVTDKAPVGLDIDIDDNQLRLHVPTHVVVFLGVDDLFPYRLEFRRSRSRAGEEDREPGASPAADESQRLLVLEFFEVQFDVPLEERLFQFAPGSRRYTDVTALFLQKRAAIP